MTEQYARITLEEAKGLYSVGVINTTTLVFLYFRIRLAQGWKAKLINRELIEELGISEASFYRAVSYLRCQGLLFWKSKGVTEYALNSETLYEEANANKKSLKATLINSSLISESKTLKNENLTLISESKTLKNKDLTLTSESKTLKNEKVTGSKPLSDKELSNPPDYLQIYFKSFSNLLQGKGEEFEKIKSFFEWWISEGIREIGFELRNPIAYLNSEDPLTKEKRLFLQFEIWKQKNSPPEWWDEMLNDPKMQKFICLD